MPCRRMYAQVDPGGAVQEVQSAKAEGDGHPGAQGMTQRVETATWSVAVCRDGHLECGSV